MKIVSFKICPFVQRVTATLEAKRVNYDIEYISLDNPPSWFIEASPNAQVPILITDSGATLFESDAIVEYLDDILAPLQENITPEKLAINRAWCYQASQHYLVQCSAMQSPNKDTLLTRSAKLGNAFCRIEKVLDSRPYFHHETIGNVDIAWLVLLHRSAIVEQHSGYDFLKDYPKVKRWQSTLLELNIADLSVSKDFKEKFSDFYFSDKTYLGRGEDDIASLPDSKEESHGCCE